jgi:hypothetical protein
MALQCLATLWWLGARAAFTMLAVGSAGAFGFLALVIAGSWINRCIETGRRTRKTRFANSS